MADQADKLRRLVCDTTPRRAVAGPPLVAVTGGKGGVGATTVAVNLAAALAERGQRVVLVDAARPRGDLADVVGIAATFERSLGDVLAGRCAAADALVPGPAGTLLLADGWAPDAPPDWSPAAEERLLAELATLGGWADVLVVDTDSGLTPWTARLWQRARLALVVTSVDDVAVMDSYATIKLGTAAMAAETDVRVVVNRCDSERKAAEVCGRIGNVCRRFLGRTVAQLPTLPAYGTGNRDEGDRPSVWRAPRSSFARSMGQLAGAVVEELTARQALGLPIAG